MSLCKIYVLKSIKTHVTWKRNGITNFKTMIPMKDESFLIRSMVLVGVDDSWWTPLTWFEFSNCDIRRTPVKKHSDRWRVHCTRFSLRYYYRQTWIIRPFAEFPERLNIVFVMLCNAKCICPSIATLHVYIITPCSTVVKFCIVIRCYSGSFQ